MAPPQAQVGGRPFASVVLLLVLLSLFDLPPAAPTTFNAIALATLTYSEDGAPADWGVDALKAALAAVEAVNAPTGVLGALGHALNVSAGVDTMCDPTVAAAAVADLLDDEAAMADVVGFLGPDCGEAAEAAATATAEDGRGLVVVSAGATASSLSDPAAYPTFVRVVPAAALYDSAVVYAAARYGFVTRAGNRAGVVFTAPDAMGEEAAAAMNATAAALGLRVGAGSSFPRNSSAAAVEAAGDVLRRPRTMTGGY